jgi:hypothetical protein
MPNKISREHRIMFINYISRPMNVDINLEKQALIDFLRNLEIGNLDMESFIIMFQLY